MAKTIIEKILARASGRARVSAGERVWAKLDFVAMRDFGGPNVILEYQTAFDCKPIFDGSKAAFTFDLHIPARDERVAKNQKDCREFARTMGMRVFDVDAGVGQHVLFEQGLVRPWDVIVGTDSHMNLLGVFGSFASGVGTTDIVAGLAYGRLWFKVPETHKFIVTGTPEPPVSAKDLILYILKTIKTDGAIYKAVEFTGSTIDAMSLASRITLASMVTEMSGKVGFIEPNDAVLQFIRERSKRKIEPVKADPDARYETTVKFEVNDLEPQIACPHSPDNVKPVRAVEGTAIDQAFIGSCTNGRFEDLEAAAQLLKGRKVKDGVRLIVVPATIEVAREALNRGLYEIFISAGAIVCNPSCALCTTGHPGILAPGEVMVSTSNRNFVGKLGKGAEVYLASPATAAASAVTGAITDPRDI